jgi:hypothetical protein
MAGQDAGWSIEGTESDVVTFEFRALIRKFCLKV